MESNKNYWEHKLEEVFQQNNQDKCTVHFEYSKENIRPIKSPAMGFDVAEITIYSLKVYTYNPKKNVSFLLLEISGRTDKLQSDTECAKKAYEEFLKMYKGEDYNTYTLEWSKKGESGTLKSFFCAKNEFQALHKFYGDKNPTEIIFFSLTLNAIA